MVRTLTFNFEFDSAFRTWTVTCNEGPGTYGIHDEPYEALLDCAFMVFEHAENPDGAERSVQPIYHQLNLDFYPYFEYTDPNEEEEERILSPLQQERARRFLEGLNG